MESDREAGRLEAKTDAKLVRQRLQLAQVKPGMRVLDAGAGSGAVSRVMCDMVTSRGEVVALDQSMRRAAFTAARATEEGINNLRVVAGDLYRSPFPAHSFDMVWCEFVFE
jgi:ubiquinone/menaquinone biosynthesis C-methylase UbiE